MKNFLIMLIALPVVLVITVACGTKTGGKTVKTVAVGNLTATLSNSTGQLKQGDQEVTLSFTDSSGKPVDHMLQLIVLRQAGRCGRRVAHLSHARNGRHGRNERFSHVHYNQHARKLPREGEYRDGRRVAGATCLRRPVRDRQDDV